MSQLEAIQQRILELTPPEIDVLDTWLNQDKQDTWNRQIAGDLEVGHLERFDWRSARGLPRWSSSQALTHQALPLNLQLLADRRHALLEQNPRHPSLHSGKVGRERWSVRVNDPCCALALEVGEGFLWLWIGLDDQYEPIHKRG